MGTITVRRRKDGSLGYTAQIRIKREGKLVHSESETFDRHALANQWMTRREAALDEQRARGEPIGKRMTVDQMANWYEKRARDPWGRTKKMDIKRIRAGSLASKRVDQLTRQDFIAYVEARRAAGAGPATAGNDLIWLRQIFKSANAVIGMPVPLPALDEAAEYLRGERTIAKPKKRDRRISAAEESKVLEYLDERRGNMPAGDLVRFALLTARRQEEITRIKWRDLDRDKGIAWLDDIKHPTRKKGNRKAFRILSEAWPIVDRQTRPLDDAEACVFPFEPKTIGAAFTRATRFLGIADLRFHDLRHEATSRLFERGYSIQEVAQFTLHESWATLKRYTHLKPEDVPQR
jgi:integrase